MGRINIILTRLKELLLYAKALRNYYFIYKGKKSYLHCILILSYTLISYIYIVIKYRIDIGKSGKIYKIYYYSLLNLKFDLFSHGCQKGD
jgi:hypothetical protein